MERCVSGISTFCCRCSNDSSNSANFFLVIGIPTRALSMSMRERRDPGTEKHTHLGIPSIFPASRTHERVKPRFYTVTHNGVETLVWRLLPSKQIQKVQLVN